VAYVVASAPAAGLAIDDLQQRLRGHLPEYMVPAVIVTLAAMPLSPNGKIDRRSLPAPSGERPTLTHTYTAPRTPVEATLAQVWAEVLRLDRVGIHDNFFALGGDSILSLQVVARAMQLGWRLAPRQVFEHPTVAALAAVATVSSGQLAAQEALVGPVPLTPIQHWFFGHELPNPHHYNQAFRFELTPAALAVLDEAWIALQQHHDALRFRYARTDEGWLQTATRVDTAGHVSTIDLRAVPASSRMRLEEAVAASVQASLHLENGPVARALVVHAADTPPHVLIVLHHLVVDGVSWRILLADFELASRQVQARQPVSLPPKTSSVRQWADALRAAATSEDFGAELPFWIATSAPAATLPRDRATGSNTIRASRTQQAILTREETQALLQELPARGAGQMLDALLASLVQALSAWTGEPTWRIDLEGHGREALGDVDVSRTVGWFTSIYPVRLTAAARPLTTLRGVKTTLRDVPQSGLAYGALRHYDVPGAEAVRDAPAAQILVNYLGQVDQALAPAGALRPAGGPTGSMRDRNAPREYELELNAIVIGGQLRLTLIHSTFVESATVARLTDHLVGALRTLIAEALTSTEEDVVLPSDFRDLDLDEGEFERIARLLDAPEAM
jgi:non-ribosomal peptide synthase protein (TIGR01720 family)